MADDTPNLILRILQEMRAEMHQRFTAVDARFETVDARLETVDTLLTEAQVDRAELRSRLVTADARLTSIDARLSVMDSRLSQLDVNAARGFEGIQKQLDGHRDFVGDRLKDHERRLLALENPRSLP